MKDHKEGFDNNPKCRLINPCKSNIGKVSKQILQKINKEVRDKLNLGQWRNTIEVVKWFEGRNKRIQHRFIQFDIIEFYPSITKELLDETIEFLSQHTVMTETNKNIAKAAAENLLYNRNESWCKKSGGSFDITMGGYAGAELCEAVGLLILHKLRAAGIEANLYRDDGLCITNKPPKAADKIRKTICSVFKSLGLRITIEMKNRVNFLDVTLDLDQDTYEPYTKENNVIKYIHASSNHPHNILKKIQKRGRGGGGNFLRKIKSPITRLTGHPQKWFCTF